MRVISEAFWRDFRSFRDRLRSPCRTRQGDPLNMPQGLAETRKCSPLISIVHSVYFPYEATSAGTPDEQRIDFVGVPYRIRTGVAAVRGHVSRQIGVRRCPPMCDKPRISLDMPSTNAHNRPRPYPGHFRDTNCEAGDGAQGSFIKVGDARGAAEAPSVEKARFRSQDRPWAHPGLSPQPNWRNLGGAGLHRWHRWHPQP